LRYIFNKIQHNQFNSMGFVVWYHFFTFFFFSLFSINFILNSVWCMTLQNINSSISKYSSRHLVHWNPFFVFVWYLSIFFHLLCFLIIWYISSTKSNIINLTLRDSSLVYSSNNSSISSYIVFFILHHNNDILFQNSKINYNDYIQSDYLFLQNNQSQFPWIFHI